MPDLEKLDVCVCVCSVWGYYGCFLALYIERPERYTENTGVSQHPPCQHNVNGISFYVPRKINVDFVLARNTLTQ